MRLHVSAKGAELINNGQQNLHDSYQAVRA